MHSIAALNAMDRAAFVAALGHVFELSPWVVERAWAARPFADRAALHAAMMAALRGASREERLAMIQVHPDLAGKAARAGAVTDDSRREQGSAGLDRLSDGEFERFDRLNTAYKARFGFPFIVAVRLNTKDTILAAFEERLRHDPDTELARAIDEIGHISRLRLEAAVA